VAAPQRALSPPPRRPRPSRRPQVVGGTRQVALLSAAPLKPFDLRGADPGEEARRPTIWRAPSRPVLCRLGKVMRFAPIRERLFELRQLHEVLWQAIKIAGRAQRLLAKLAGPVLSKQQAHQLDLEFEVPRTKLFDRACVFREFQFFTTALGTSTRKFNFLRLQPGHVA
jgi:hypothetical protein